MGQHTKALWLSLREQNTKLFHRVTFCNKKINRISALECDGEIFSNTCGIKGKIIFFLNKWGTGPLTYPSWTSFNPPITLFKETIHEINEDDSFSDILHDVSSIGPTHAPGAKGITSTFIKGSGILWTMSSLLRLKFFYKGTMPRSWKENMVVLIPK